MTFQHKVTIWKTHYGLLKKSILALILYLCTVHIYHHLKFPLQWFYGNFMTSNEVQPCKTQNHEIIL